MTIQKYPFYVNSLIGIPSHHLLQNSNIKKVSLTFALLFTLGLHGCGGESIDTDGDGVGDNADVFPLDASESIDTDGDGVGDNEDIDDDNDGMEDNNDAFPYNSAEKFDFDHDGIGDNEDIDDDNDGMEDGDDIDDDNDGIEDDADAFPNNDTPACLDIAACILEGELKKQVIAKYKNAEQLVISVIGDSTSRNLGVNAGTNVWTNGVAYAATNQPNAYPNLNIDSPFYTELSTYPTQEQQDNLLIPSAVRKFRTLIESKNPTSIVANWSVPGWDAYTHLNNGTVALVKNQVPKPQICIINLGIISARNRMSMTYDLRTIVDELLAAGIFVLLAQPNNIAVVGGQSGSWNETSLPNTWFPLDYWHTTVAEIKTVGMERNTGFVNVGTENLQLDITKFYDPFHPNEDGYADIADRYIAWFENN